MGFCTTQILVNVWKPQHFKTVLSKSFRLLNQVKFWPEEMLSGGGDDSLDWLLHNVQLILQGKHLKSKCFQCTILRKIL